MLQISPGDWKTEDGSLAEVGFFSERRKLWVGLIGKEPDA